MSLDDNSCNVGPSEFAMRRSGVRSPSAPPVNLVVFNHLQGPYRLAPKIIWREVDVAEAGFVCKALRLSWTSSKKSNETVVEVGAKRSFYPDRRADYAEVTRSIWPFACRRHLRSTLNHR